jgi:hypothetical protein
LTVPAGLPLIWVESELVGEGRVAVNVGGTVVEVGDGSGVLVGHSATRVSTRAAMVPDSSAGEATPPIEPQPARIMDRMSRVMQNGFFIMIFVYS